MLVEILNFLNQKENKCMQDIFMTNGSWATCQAKKEELIFKASGFEILLCWGPVIQ